jgi:hypothetical protein
MSDDDDEEETPESGAEEGYEVGYKKPPKSGQFRKGEPSRNPRGRPRKKRKTQRPLPNEVRIAERILAESRRPVKIRENGKVEEIPMIDAVMRSVGAKAVQGDPRAGAAYIQLTDRAEATIIKEWNAVIDSVLEYKAGWREAFEQYDRAGKARPEPIPHPDEVILDYAAMEVRYNGPTSELQAQRWEEQRERVRSAREYIRELKVDLRKEPPTHHRFLQEEIAWEMAIIAHIDSLLPSKQTRRAPGFDLRRWRAENSVEGVRPKELKDKYLAELRTAARRH